MEVEKNGQILSNNVAILEDVIHLDSLRHSRGLPNMKDYIKDWDLQDYNAYLPYAQELLKKHTGL
jgi:hypothetical protein